MFFFCRVLGGKSFWEWCLGDDWDIYRFIHQKNMFEMQYQRVFRRTSKYKNPAPSASTGGVRLSASYFASGTNFTTFAANLYG